MAASRYQTNLVSSGIADLIKTGQCRATIIGDSTADVNNQVSFSNALVDEWRVTWKEVWCLGFGSGAVSSGASPNFTTADYTGGSNALYGTPWHCESNALTVTNCTVNQGLFTEEDVTGVYKTIPTGLSYCPLPRYWTQHIWTADYASANQLFVKSYIGRFSNAEGSVSGYNGGDWTDANMEFGLIFAVPASGTAPASGTLAANVQKPASAGTAIGSADFYNFSYSGLSAGDVFTQTFTRTAAQMTSGVPTADQRWLSDILDNRTLTTTSCAWGAAVRFGSYLTGTNDENGNHFISFGAYVKNTDVTTGFALDGITLGGASIKRFYTNKASDAAEGLFDDRALVKYMNLYQPNLLMLMFAVNASSSPNTEWSTAGTVAAGKYKENIRTLIQRWWTAADSAGKTRPKILLFTPNPDPLKIDNGQRPAATHRQWTSEANELATEYPTMVAVIDWGAWALDNFTNTQLKVLQPDTVLEGSPGTGGIHPNRMGSRRYMRFAWSMIEGASEYSQARASHVTIVRNTKPTHAPGRPRQR